MKPHESAIDGSTHDDRSARPPRAQGSARGRWTLRPRPADEERGARRTSASAIVSVALHVLLGAALLHVVMLPYPLRELFTSTRAKEPVRERISFLTLPREGGAAVATPGKSGGDGRPERPGQTAPPPLVAPREVPTSLPPVPPASTPRAPEGGSGPVIGGGGPTKGVRPALSDPRIWVPQAGGAGATAAAPPKTSAERLDSVIVATLKAHEDSMRRFAPEPTKFERGDWTVEKDGQKWGIDKKFIRLGKVSIPTALLGLLPLNNVQGNPIAADRERALAVMRADILEHAVAAQNEAEFRKTVRAIRERKERERLEKARQVATPDASGGARP